jgi:GT2 family glycosyltransferase
MFQDLESRNMPDIEVLICTHNRAALLERTLSSINTCVLPTDCIIGIFVIANACTDDTHEFLENYISSQKIGAGNTTNKDRRLPLRWLADPIPGKSHALNFSLPQTTGSIIAFVDDDHRVDPGYLKAIWDAACKHPGADLFCGRILPDWDGTEPVWVHEDGAYRIYPLPVPRFDLGDEPIVIAPGGATPGGGNIAIRRGLFERIGDFQLDLGPQGHNLGGAEDIEWVRRAMDSGTVLRYVPDMLQYHYVDSQRMTLWYIMRKAYERSASTTRLSKKSGEGQMIPPFMIRKSLTYLTKALISIRQKQRRFYLTRLAAALGEIKGFRIQAKKQHSTNPINRDNA